SAVLDQPCCLVSAGCSPVVAPVLDDMQHPSLLDAYCPLMRPGFDLQGRQRSFDACHVLLRRFKPEACALTPFELVIEAAPRCALFQPEQGRTQAMLGAQRTQAISRGTLAAEEAIQPPWLAEIDISCPNRLRSCLPREVALDAPRAQVTVAP